MVYPTEQLASRKRMPSVDAMLTIRPIPHLRRWGRARRVRRKRALDVDRPEIVQGFLVALVKIYLAPDACIVDQHLQRPKLGKGALQPLRGCARLLCLEALDDQVIFADVGESRAPLRRPP